MDINSDCSKFYAAPQRVPEGFLRRPIRLNRETLDKLFQCYRSRLYKAALRLMGNHDDAEDALQDGLLAAFRNLNRFEGRSQFSTWLTRIVINAALMRRRSNRIRQTISFDQAFEESSQALDVTLPDPGPNPEEIYARREQLQHLERAIGAMPETYRRALRLRHVEGMTIKEVAGALGLATGTLKSQLHRTRQRLRDQAAEGPPERSGAHNRTNSFKFGEECSKGASHSVYESRPRELAALIGHAAQNNH